MPCPYAQRKGPVVICQVTKKKVNPLAAPCLTNRYIRCKFYVQAVKSEEKRKANEIMKAEEKAEVAKAKKGEIKGLTKDGKRPKDCTECVYYSPAAKMCLLLKTPVSNPKEPPCTKT